MIQLAAPFFLALLSTGDHAALHAAEANLYVEFPDLPAAMAAYHQAPLVRLATDAEVGGVVRALAGLPEDFDIVGGLMTQLESMLGIDTFSSGRLLYELSADLRSASFSIGGIAEGTNSAELAQALQNDPLSLFGYLDVQLVLEFGEAAIPEQMVEMASEALAAAPDADGATAIALMGADRRIQRLVLQDVESAPRVWMVAADRLLIVGSGKASPESLAARAAGGASVLSRTDTPNTHFSNPAGATIYQSSWWLPGAPFYADALREASDAGAGVAETLLGGWIPLEPQTSHARLQLRNGLFVKDSFESLATTKVIDPIDAMGKKPLDAAVLSRVGPDAIWVFASSVSREGVRGFADLLIGMVLDAEDGDDESVTDSAGADEQSGGEAAAILAEFGPMLDGVLASVGEDLCVYMLPIAGLKVPQLHVLLGLNDAAAFEQSVTEFAQKLQEQAGGTLSVDTRPYRKQPVISLRPDLEALGVPPMVSVDLTIGIVGNRAIVGVSAMDVKKEMRRLLSDEAAAHPMAVEGAVPEGVGSVSYMDWAALVGGIYETARTFAALVPDAGMLPIDVTQLPEAKLFTRFFQPSRSWTRVVEGGTYTFSESSFGPELMLAGFGGAVMFAGNTSSPFGGPEPSPSSIEVAPRSPAEPMEPTRQALQQVKLGLVLYRSDRGALPTELAALLETSEAFPTGYLRRDTLPMDGWGQALRFELIDGGQGFQLWSVGADGVDERGTGDDILAP